MSRTRNWSRRGWFSVVRNPIYTAMIVGWIGFALIVPTWLAFAAVVVIAFGLELQVRAVEEPYLVRTHGGAYSRLRGAGRPLRARCGPLRLGRVAGGPSSASVLRTPSSRGVVFHPSSR